MRLRMLSRFSVVSVVVLGATLGAFAQLRIGDPMPQTGVRLSSVEGSISSVEHMQGDAGTLLIFVSNTCDRAEGWKEEVSTLARHYRALGVNTVLVNSNDAALSPEDSDTASRDTSRAIGIDHYLMDPAGQVARAFGVKQAPTAYLFDPNGRLIYRGALADDLGEPYDRYVENALESMLERRDPDINETSVFGCELQLGN